jgi:hypothetical protein
MIMKWTSIFARTATALALAMAVAVPISARGDEHDKDRDKSDQQAAQDDQDEIRQLKVFELEHRDPQQINQIITMRTRTAALAPGQAVVPVRPGVVPRTAHFRPMDSDRVATAVNSEEKLLFVRGSEDQIKEVEQLVNAFDVKDEDIKAHDYGKCRLIPVHSKNVGQVQTTLSQLNLPGQMMRLGDVSLFVFHTDDGNDQKREQAEEVIEKLDARVKDQSQGQDEDQDDKDQDDKDQDDEQDDNNGDA